MSADIMVPINARQAKLISQPIWSEMLRYDDRADRHAENQNQRGEELCRDRSKELERFYDSLQKAIKEAAE